VYTSAIAVSGNDVYIAGYEQSCKSEQRNSHILENGIAVNLRYRLPRPAIFISGNDVYVVGYEAVLYTNSLPNTGKTESL
jgi:hypothetical protein